MSATALAKRAGVAAVACTGYDILVGLGILDRVPADVLELKPKTSKVGCSGWGSGSFLHPASAAAGCLSNAPAPTASGHDKQGARPCRRRS